MMKLQALATLLAIVASTEATGLNQRHAHLAHRQASPASSATSAASSASASGSVPPASGASSAATGAATAAVPTGATAATTDPLFTLTAATSDVPPLGQISSGMPTGTPWQASTTYQAGAQPTFSNAPPLPAPFVFSPSVWPPQDKVPPTDSNEVKAWLKELDGWNIPNIPLNVDNTCASNPQAAQDAAKNGWWTCGGHTRSTDIVQCPDKMTWGVSFDDGPSEYTPLFLDQKNLSATFFVVGSRVISRPDILRDEYMAGHEISVHTWSHTALTTLSNEQIVAELGWTRKAIKDVLGVTPTTMRPPYGDMDDRVRAISLAMGMIPISWTTAPNGATFDTFDWRVAGGLVSAPVQYRTFQDILGNASTMNNGQISVDLAVGFTLDAALTHNPPFTLKPIGECSKIPTSNLYLESNTNKTFPFTNSSAANGGADVNGDGKPDTKSGTGSSNSAFIVSPVTAYSLAGFAALGAILL
uniref:chitin deacetylase n=1 Tax=Moniliophthora roreri TaxID=221103 RepID=A0A0W0G8K9_MONRR